MNTDSLGYIQDFIDKMMSEKGIVKVIKKNYAINMSENDFDKISIQEADKFLYKYSSRTMISAFDPFLDIIRQIILNRELDINVVLDEVEVYPLNRSTFVSYVETGIARCDEIPIQTEKEYNVKRMTQDVLNILLYLADMHKIFIFAIEANQMCDSSIWIYNRLIDLDNENLRVLLFTNEMGSIKEYVKTEFTAFISRLDRKGMIYEWPFEVAEEDKKSDSSFTMLGKMEELDTIFNMFYTYAWNQAAYYLGMLYQKVEVEKVKVSEEYRYNLFILNMMISVYNGSCSTTLNIAEKFSKIDFDMETREKDYYCTYYKAMALMYAGSEKDSIDMANRCLEIAKELDDEKKLFKAELLVNMSLLRGWKDVWLCDKEIDISEEFLTAAKKYGYINHLAHIYIYCYDNEHTLYSKVEGIENRIPTVTKGIELAKEIGNDLCLLEAYRKNIMISSFNGYFEVTNYFYKTIIEIVRKIGNRVEEAGLYNGIGYVSSAYDGFLEANRYYNKALKIYYEEKSSDYIIETIYNIGMNAIIAGDYSHATEYFSCVISLLAQLKRDRVRVCNVSKVLGLLALSCYKEGDLYSAQMYASKSKNFLKSVHAFSGEGNRLPLWDDDLFLYFLVSAALCHEKKDYVNALSNYESAEFYINRSKGSRFFNLLQYLLEKPKTLRAIGRDDEAEKVIKDGIKWYKSTNNDMRVRMFEEILKNPDFVMPPVCIELNEIKLEEIRDFIEDQKLITAAKVRMDRIRIFDTFQQLTNTEFESIDNVIQTLITSFKGNFSVDNVLLVSCENESPKIMYSDIPYEISNDSLKVIENHFKENTSGFVLSKYSNNYSEYQNVLNIFDKSKIFSIIGVPIYKKNKLSCYFITFMSCPASWNSSIRGTFDNEDLEVFSIIFRQMIEATEKYIMNQALISQAITDELTGLYNRKGFYELLDKIVDKTIKQGNRLDCTIMYMDLDHFKYYNDTFGHSVGDVIIKAFADIFRKASEGEGEVIRFGGDEFLVIIESANKSKINKIIDRIYAIIAAQDGFEKLVSDTLGETITISKEVRASCSIGIAMGIDIKDANSINEIQMNADKALYDVKETGRGRAKFF